MSTLNNFNAEDTEETLDGYLTDALSKIWESRKTKPPPSDPSHWKSILDDIRGQNEICTYNPSIQHNCYIYLPVLDIPQVIGVVLYVGSIFGTNQVCHHHRLGMKQ